MEYQVLARKFRPQNFEEIVGQEHIRLILQNAIIQNNIAHAYLFCGTRGVGKTTAARVFAKAIMCSHRDANGNPCLKCDSCTQVDSASSLDYLEIDGASNNSVENIRELIDNVQYLPTNGKYKVYVIDEVHMLSTSAFNALLKTLEEPPAHVVFIFATTDPHKLLDTVVSRCQKIEFRNLNEDELRAIIANVAAKEGIKFESDDVVEALCEHGNGSGRDVLSVLELLKNITSDKIITFQSLANILGIPEKKIVKDFLIAMLKGEIEKVNSLYDGVVKGPVDLVKFHIHLQKVFFQLIEEVTTQKKITNFDNINFENFSMAELMWTYEVMNKDFGWITSSTMLEQNLKLLYIKLTLRKQLLSREKLCNIEVKKKSNLTEDYSSKENVELEIDKEIVQEEPIAIEEENEEVEARPASEEVVIDEIEDETEELPRSTDFYYPDFIEDLFEIDNTIAANLERGNLLEEATLENGQLSLIIGFSEDERLFYDMISEHQTKRKLEEIIYSMYEINENGLSIQIRLLDNLEIDQKNFKSKVEVDEQNKIQEKQEQREKLLNNDYIKNAETIFESKVKQVVLND